MIPLTVLKQALRIDFSTDDRELQRLVDAAVSYIEDYIGFGLCSSTETIYLKDFGDKLLNDDRDISVSYNDGTTAVAMTEGTDFWIDRSDGLVLRFINKPSFKVGTQPIVTITSGYASLPKDLQQAIVGLVAHWYQKVESTSDIMMTDVPFSTQAILDRRRKIGCVR